MEKISSKISLILLVIFLIAAYSFTTINDVQVKGWFISGSKPDSYEIGIVMDKERDSKVAYLKSKEKINNGFGTIMQTFSASKYSGKKMKLTGFIKTEDVKGWVGMWMRVDGEKRHTLSFDNMQDRKIEGSTAWKSYEIILNVPLESSTINYGVLLREEGVVFLDDLVFEEVESTKLSTGREYKSEPTNASFEE